MSPKYTKCLFDGIATIFVVVSYWSAGVFASENVWLVEGTTSATNGSNETESCPRPHEEGKRFHVAKFDFWNVETPLLIALWVLFVSLTKVAFHSKKILSKLFPESCLLIVLGVILGIILYFADDHSDRHQLNTHTFFLVILPPIIMDAGYFMPSRSFFDQFGTIFLYAVVNTFINTIWIGFTLWGIGLTGLYGEDVCFPLLHALVFASLLAAVDPVAVLAVFESVHVNEMLYIIVFGEALLNDGIAVVLYHVFEGFSLIGQENIIAVDIIAGIVVFRYRYRRPWYWCVDGTFRWLLFTLHTSRPHHGTDDCRHHLLHVFPARGNVPPIGNFSMHVLWHHNAQVR